MGMTPNPKRKQKAGRGLGGKPKTLKFQGIGTKKGLTSPDCYGRISPH